MNWGMLATALILLVRRWHSLALPVAVVPLAGVLALAAPPCVAFISAPTVTTEDGPVTISLHVAPHDDHATLAVSAMDGTLVIRRSEMPLHGAEAAPQQRVAWWGLPTGEFVLVAAVYDGQDQRLAQVRRQITVADTRGP